MNAPFTLRPYQQEAVEATLRHFRRSDESAVIVLTFASVQSVAANLDQFRDDYSLIIIDECHRVSGEETSQYQRIIELLRRNTISPRWLRTALANTPRKTPTSC